MSTKITVAIGADGEVRRSREMRDGARSNRLDSEATNREARKASADKVEGDEPGRDNEKPKREPVIEPAAHARKKKLTGQFAGVQIQYKHWRLENKTWDKLRDAKYLDITFRTIDQAGAMAEPIKIELTRNLITDTFCFPVPDDHEFIRFRENANNTEWTNVFYWPFDPNWSFGFRESTDVYLPIGFQDFAVFAGGYYTYLGSEWLRTGTTGSIVGFYAMSPRNNSKLISPYHIASDPRETPESLKDLQGFPGDAVNHNIKINGRVEEDEQVSGWIDHHKDPLHEVFLLPFTGETTFLLVIYSDYLIKTRAFIHQMGECQSELNGEAIDQFQRVECTTVDYERYLPTWHVPAGYEFPQTKEVNWANGSYDQPYDAVITEAGSAKIQQIRLFKIENGVAEEVVEIPEKLRDAADNLSTNFKGRPIRSSSARRRNAFRQYVFAEHRRAYFNNRFPDKGFVSIYDTFEQGDGWRMYWPLCSFMNNQLIDGQLDRMYKMFYTEERSIAKGYGMGNLSTRNHFDSRYIGRELRGFWDDKYFTPMVYQYLKGHAECSKLYERVNTSLVTKPDYFVDIGKAATEGKVRFANERPSLIDTPYSGSYEAESQAPSLKNATHMCWNWGLPGHCWDELKALGFGPELIGTRPKDEE